MAKRRTKVQTKVVKRRSSAQMKRIRRGLVQLVANNAPVTVRQAFYLAVAKRLIKKTEDEYKTVIRLLTDLRRSGEIAWGDIQDYTRVTRKETTHSDIRAALREAVKGYSRDIWQALPVNVQLWTEKETLTGVLGPVASQYQVSLTPCRGYPSLSLLYDVAKGLPRDRPTIAYYVGDWDPSGKDIPRTVRERVAEFSRATFTLERLAVLPEQVEKWKLPTRPTKKRDTRAKNWKGPSVEAEAIEPAVLRRLCQEAVEQHLPAKHIRQVLQRQKQELQDIEGELEL